MLSKVSDRDVRVMPASMARQAGVPLSRKGETTFAEIPGLRISVYCLWACSTST